VFEGPGTFGRNVFVVRRVAGSDSFTRPRLTDGGPGDADFVVAPRLLSRETHAKAVPRPVRLHEDPSFAPRPVIRGLGVAPAQHTRRPGNDRPSVAQTHWST
jgi:hypothetical protein